MRDEPRAARERAGGPAGLRVPKPARVGVLLLALALTASWGYARVHARAERRRWDRPVDVLVYVLGAAGPAALGDLRADLERLSARLAEDRAAYGAGPGPFRFELAGPVVPARWPPATPPGPGWLERARYVLAVWRAERAVRAVAPEPDARAFDVRLYLVASSSVARSFAEGAAEAGGEVAVVRASLEPDALLAATAVAHEALHAVGATDKYDAAGHALAPGGLFEPERSPAYPQRRAELMVGEVPTGPGRGRLPERAEELGVGPQTAREIGWVREGG